MKKNVEKVQISIGGVILGITAMGNLFHDFFPHSREILGSVALILILLILLKLFYYPKYFKQDLDNPVLASIIATFSMTLMLIASYLKPYLGYELSIFLWIFAIMLHLFLLINYIYKFVIKFKLENFSAGTFVVFAGVQMIAITAPVFHQEFIGSIAFYFSFVSVILVFLVVCYRYIKTTINSPLKPVIGVYAAPFSLCLVGYLSSVRPNNLFLVIGMYILTKILYVMVLVKFVEFRNLPFYPTYAAYTFPIVINTIATLQTYEYLTSLGFDVTFLFYLLQFEIIIAVVLVLYVLYYYLISIFEIQRKELNF